MQAIKNRKAYFDYFIQDKYEAGLSLMGPEVKSIRAGKATLSDSYVRIKQGEAFVINMYIAPYEYAHNMDIQTKRSRKLLLHKKEIEQIERTLKEKAGTVVPLKLYFNARGKAKLQIAVAKGKQKHDKRDSLKKKVQQREIDRAMKHT